VSAGRRGCWIVWLLAGACELVVVVNRLWVVGEWGAWFVSVPVPGRLVGWVALGWLGVEWEVDGG
jgi:hypothetical protein